MLRGSAPLRGTWIQGARCARPGRNFAQQMRSDSRPVQAEALHNSGRFRERDFSASAPGLLPACWQGVEGGHHTAPLCVSIQVASCRAAGALGAPNRDRWTSAACKARRLRHRVLCDPRRAANQTNDWPAANHPDQRTGAATRTWRPSRYGTLMPSGSAGGLKLLSRCSRSRAIITSTNSMVSLSATVLSRLCRSPLGLERAA